MKYDDASWHYGGDYPEGLPIENAFTHAGIFIAWCINHGLVSEEFIEDFADEAKHPKSTYYLQRQAQVVLIMCGFMICALTGTALMISTLSLP